MRHPDEGTIHAWLDGALPEAEGHALEAHAADCATCAAAVAEARGLLAASSRILSALDSVPAGVIPEAPTMTSGARAAVRRRAVRKGLHVSNGVWRAAAAIVVFVIAGWLAERSAHRWRERDAVPRVALAAYSDTTSIRVPGVVVDAPVPQRAAESYAMADAYRGRAGRESARDQADAQAKARADSVAGTSEIEVRGEGVMANVAAERRAASAKVAVDSVVVATAPVEAQVQSYLGQRMEAPVVAPAPAASRDMAKAATRSTKLVVDRAYVDSVLAADSLDALDEGQSWRLTAPMTTGYTAGAAAAPAAPPAAGPALRRRELAASDNPIARAAGCWALDTGRWSPRAREAQDALLPPRVELLTKRGLLGDERGELTLRPAPGEDAFPAGTAATWKPIGRDGYRLTVGDSTRWVVATLTLEGDSLRGRVRDYSGDRGQIRTAEVRGRRVVCRTEP